MIKIALGMLIGFALLGFVCSVIEVDLLLAVAVLQQTGGMNNIPKITFNGA